uniref:Uncharacterized protein n=1 Tax=Siphoviridae sp. ctZHD14 TaxID=2827891 RepID=A0A8S5SW29_9CAUD|nr:MAG TPA: hypothetical protein [Siphoviridae sp. ctZHD14]
MVKYIQITDVHDLKKTSVHDLKKNKPIKNF